MRSRRGALDDRLDRSLRLALKGMVAGHRPPREIRSAVLREAASLEKPRRQQHSWSMWLRDLGIMGGEYHPVPSRRISLEPFATSLGVLALRR